MKVTVVDREHVFFNKRVFHFHGLARRFLDLVWVKESYLLLLDNLLPTHVEDCEYLMWWRDSCSDALYCNNEYMTKYVYMNLDKKESLRKYIRRVYENNSVRQKKTNI